MPKKIFFAFVIFSLSLFACTITGTAVPPSQTAVPTDTAVIATISPTIAPTDTPLPPPTDTVAAATDTPAPTDTPVPSSNPAAANYVDDRSTASQVIVSFYNAINRHEYSRAYDYYNDPAGTIGAFSAFQTGYANTISVTLTFGTLSGEGAAGSVYFTVPALLTASESGNVTSYYADCYVVRLVEPGNFGAPPVQPMGIESASGQKVTAGTDPNSACASQPQGPDTFPAGGESLSIDKSNYVDNRSGALETVSSYLNAINSNELVRAYSYFQDPTTFPGPYPAYETANTGTSVTQVAFGTVTSEGAAGSLYYKVPAVLETVTSSSTNQRLSGCFTLRLANPGIQAAPPFQPMGIVTDNLQPASASADVNTLLASACQ